MTAKRVLCPVCTQSVPTFPYDETVNRFGSQGKGPVMDLHLVDGEQCRGSYHAPQSV